MSNNKTVVGVAIKGLVAVYIAVVLSCIGGIAWTIIHFASKYW